MKRSENIARFLVWITAFLSLLPVARLVVDWIELNRVLDGTAVQMSGRSFDWVHWQEDEGIIFASYVVPQGSAARAGIRDGDIFFMLEGQQYFNVEDLQRAIEGIEPGTTRTFYVQRDGEFVEANVRFTRYPTFLYPLSAALWHFSVWGFLVAAFIHVIGLVIVGPLALRSPTSRFSLLLIVASSLWIFGNLVRLLMVEIAGPPLSVGSTYDRVFQAMAIVGVIGWIGFPALLVHRVAGELSSDGEGPGIGMTRFGVYLPAAVLGTGAFLTTFSGSTGPITVDGLVAPILFYACCYVATAGALMLIRAMVPSAESSDSRTTWSPWGSAIMIALALLVGLSVLGIVPLFGAVTETMSGWLIVGAQLLSVVPVILVSHATLKHGKVSQVLSRGLTWVLVSGVVFFAFVGGMSVLEPYFDRMAVSRNVLAGMYAVVLLVAVEWLVRRLRGSGLELFATERQSMYRTVQQLQEHVRSILDYDTLAHQAVQAVGSAFSPRSAVIALRPDGEAGPWVTATFHPEPPYVTERVVSSLWPHIPLDGGIWARNPELNEMPLPDHLQEVLYDRRTALLVPVVGRDRLIGIVALGSKAQRSAVYNLEEVELLRTLAGQLALAIERLGLVERERALVKESAEAQLVALRAQINPHFLFNSLNTIVSLIGERPDEAEQVVEHLAAIFRYILQAEGRDFIPMEDEFALIGHYLRIEQSRFGGSLEVEEDLDPSLRGFPVPAFVVQTLVENAVKHGLGRKRGGGTVSITCRPDPSGHVVVDVSDTGVGIPQLFDTDDFVSTTQDFFGIGLRNVASRLEKLYGRDDLLELSSAPDEGTDVRIRLPLRDVKTDGTDQDASALEINSRFQRFTQSERAAGTKTPAFSESDEPGVST